MLYFVLHTNFRFNLSAIIYMVVYRVCVNMPVICMAIYRLIIRTVIVMMIHYRRIIGTMVVMVICRRVITAMIIMMRIPRTYMQTGRIYTNMETGLRMGNIHASGC